MHFKYSNILVQVFVSFAYGLFLPLLFPIAMIGIFNMYVVERLSLAYYFRQPPVYDGKLNAQVLSILKWAPFFMLCLGYWALGNRQVFFGEASNIMYSSSNHNPLHKLLDYSKGLNGTILLVGYVFFLLLNIFFEGLLINCLKKLNVIKKDSVLDQDFDVDENLDTYWKCLRAIDQKNWYAREVYHRKGLNLRTIN